MSRFILAGVALLLTGASAAATAAESAQDFYKGKTISYIVATSPGGGYDTYGRLVARYMNKYLPGSKIIIRNLPGAGHVIGANTIYASRPDGLTIGTFNTGLIYLQLLHESGVRFDLAKMSWIGKAASDTRVLVLSKSSGGQRVSSNSSTHPGRRSSCMRPASVRPVTSIHASRSPRSISTCNSFLVTTAAKGR